MANGDVLRSLSLPWMSRALTLFNEKILVREGWDYAPGITINALVHPSANSVAQKWKRIQWA